MSVIEGLLCPECFKEFGSVNQLSLHFQSAHSDTSEESNAVLNVLKKAKFSLETILGSKEDIIETIHRNNHLNDFVPEDNVSYAFYENSVITQPGCAVDRTAEFQSIRGNRLRYAAIDVSKLLIKLEKMINFNTSGSKDRKKFEQELVEWVDDSLVPFCPSCGSKFGLPSLMNSGNGGQLLVRKKHHCRLCGGIMCAICSFMLPLSEASRLIELVNLRLNTDRLDSLARPSGRIGWREDSLTSLDSIKTRINRQEKEYSVRCCANCKQVIESKWTQTSHREDESDIIAKHRELKIAMNKTEDFVTKYNTILQSLLEGASEYSHEQAHELRAEIVEECQKIDKIGNHFKTRGQPNINGGGGGGESKREAMLFMCVSRACSCFLQTHFATLKELPSRETLLQLAETRRKRIRAEASRQTNRPPTTVVQRVPGESDGGWAPSLPGLKTTTNKNPFEVDEQKGARSPEEMRRPEEMHLRSIAEQMENVRHFIQLAGAARRFDEVNSLKQNMQDLETEYDRIRTELKNNFTS